MKIYSKINDLAFNPATVITVGAFDGLHLGHRKILERLAESARERNYRQIVVTFARHPQLVLKDSGRAPLKLLTSHEERMELFERYGVENVLLIDFTHEFSEMPAARFVKEFLFEKVGFRRIIIGYDHLFGKNREGNETLLLRMGQMLGFDVEKVDPFVFGGQIISSSKVRLALLDGRVEQAAQWLGYPYSIAGEVIYGEQLGRRLGYPTANINPDESLKLFPKDGIYLVKSEIDGQMKHGMANLGIRPTVGGEGARRLEVNYFDFAGDLYGRTLRVEFEARLRDEKRFSSLDELVEQIRRDEENCRMLIK